MEDVAVPTSPSRKATRSETVFYTQALILFTVILFCIYNLSKEDVTNQAVWTTLLASSLGYILPSPSISRKKKKKR